MCCKIVIQKNLSGPEKGLWAPPKNQPIGASVRLSISSALQCHSSEHLKNRGKVKGGSKDAAANRPGRGPTGEGKHSQLKRLRIPKTPMAWSTLLLDAHKCTPMHQEPNSTGDLGWYDRLPKNWSQLTSGFGLKTVDYQNQLQPKELTDLCMSFTRCQH